MKKIALAAFLLLALLAFSLRAAGPTCRMPMRGATTRQCADCCAMMKSCTMPQQKNAPLTDLTPLTPPVIAIIAPAPGVLLFAIIPSPAVSLEAAPAQLAAVSPPRLALLCTRLI